MNYFMPKKEGEPSSMEHRITVSRTHELDGSFLCTGFPYDVRERSDFYLRYFEAFITRSLALRRPGSAVLDLCYVAAGRFDGFWEMKLHAWDVAAASLLVDRGRGKINRLQGKSLQHLFR